jgi:hypothetical protein
MRKLALQLGHDIQEEKKRSKVPGILLVVFLVIGLGPLLLEGTSICLANWKELMGVSASVKTPVMDSVQENLETLQQTFWSEVTPFFRQLPWEPKMVLPASALVMAVAMLMLRR